MADTCQACEQEAIIFDTDEWWCEECYALNYSGLYVPLRGRELRDLKAKVTRLEGVNGALKDHAVSEREEYQEIIISSRHRYQEAEEEVKRLEGELAAETAMCDQVIHAFVAQKEALRKWDGWLRYASKGFEMDESFKIIIEKALAGEEPPEVG